ncbi:MAG: nucleotide exchange factor GrpE [Bacteroidota bacterium]
MVDEHTETNGKESVANGEKQSAPVQESETDSLLKRIAELEKVVESTKDQLLRKAADFENYRRRIEGDMAMISRFANEGLILELLPILDDFTRSMKSGKDRSEFGPFFQGVELIYSKLMKILEAQGVTPIECIGKEFNVDFHDALMQMPKEGVTPHTIIEEVEKGYMLFDKVLRHAKVVVASEPQDVKTASGSTHEAAE